LYHTETHVPNPTYDDAFAVLQDAKATIQHVLDLLRIWQNEPKKTRLPAPEVVLVGDEWPSDFEVKLQWPGVPFWMCFRSPTKVSWGGFDETKLDGTGHKDGIDKLSELIRRGKK
jgi:hypothetical protein